MGQLTLVDNQRIMHCLVHVERAVKGMDGSHGIDARRFSVYLIVNINGHGKGQIVFGAYLRREAGYSID